MLDREKFKDKIIVQGDAEASYYTNSSHVPVNSDVLLPEKIKIEEKFHPLTLGGHIFHAFMGEAYSEPDSLMSLTQKIARKSDLGFWAYSSALSFCIKMQNPDERITGTMHHLRRTKRSGMVRPHHRIRAAGRTIQIRLWWMEPG